ncbi:MAG: type II toxin-antitoxin system PemK/MazF family toxin [Candidatus Sungbacteria bacterium]|nr:type II toxin-antitoxin system PemK/MazF family toxin [Candidatus Sungbacteria bacterium]
MKKGEIWLVEIPGIDGHEQRGFRPAIFIADTKTGVAIIIPCTSNLQALRFPFTIRIESSRSNGLNELSVALVLQLRAIDKKRLLRKIGQLDNSVLKELDVVIRNLLDL